MRDNEYIITENKCIAENIFLMKLKGDTEHKSNYSSRLRRQGSDEH